MYTYLYTIPGRIRSGAPGRRGRNGSIALGEQIVTERMIEIGGLRIHLQPDEDPVSLLRSLMRYVSNQEIADILGVSERTVRRWKNAGRLPRRGHARLKLADLLAYLSNGGTGKVSRARKRGGAAVPG